MILLSSHSRSVKSVAGNDDSPGGAGKVKFLWSSFANCRSCCLDLYIKILFVLLEKVKKEFQILLEDDTLEKYLDELVNSKDVIIEEDNIYLKKYYYVLMENSSFEAEKRRNEKKQTFFFHTPFFICTMLF